MSPLSNWDDPPSRINSIVTYMDSVECLWDQFAGEYTTHGSYPMSTLPETNSQRPWKLMVGSDEISFREGNISLPADRFEEDGIPSPKLTTKNLPPINPPKKNQISLSVYVVFWWLSSTFRNLASQLGAPTTRGFRPNLHGPERRHVSSGPLCAGAGSVVVFVFFLFFAKRWAFMGIFIYIYNTPFFLGGRCWDQHNGFPKCLTKVHWKVGVPWSLGLVSFLLIPGVWGGCWST